MRIKPLIAAMAAAAGILTLLTAPSAAASGSSITGVCYDGGYYWDAGYENGVTTTWIPGGDDRYDTLAGSVRVYQASSRCKDVNIRIFNYNSLPYVLARVCFYPSSGGYSCNSWKRFNAGDYAWRVIASDVLDRTKFEVEFDRNGRVFEGVIAH